MYLQSADSSWEMLQLTFIFSFAKQKQHRKISFSHLITESAIGAFLWRMTIFYND